MVDYQILYTMLFNGITDAIELIEKSDISSAKELLVLVQQKAEDKYIEAE